MLTCSHSKRAHSIFKNGEHVLTVSSGAFNEKLQGTSCGELGFHWCYTCVDVEMGAFTQGLMPEC